MNLSEHLHQKAQACLELAKLGWKVVKGQVIGGLVAILLNNWFHFRGQLEALEIIFVIVACTIGLAGMFSWMSATTFNKHWTVESKYRKEAYSKSFDEEWKRIRDDVLGKQRGGSAYNGEILIPTPVRHHYAFMELPDGSDASSTKARYHTLMRRCHPDLTKDKVAQEKAQHLTAAYKEIRAFLRREAKRAQVDSE